MNGNPFSTCHVRPGAVAYRFPDTESAERLVAKLEQYRWRGQIVGPHGTGKTTLLHALVPILEQRGRQPIWITLHAPQRRFHKSIRDGARSWREHSQVIVDGYEQLGFPSRRWLHWRCRRARCGLLITTHAPARMPHLFHTRSSLQLVRDITNGLLEGHSGCISPEDVARCFAMHGGNVRDTLFALYDIYQRRRL